MNDYSPDLYRCITYMDKYSPDHYKKGRIETWDYIADQNLDYFLGNAIKYISRAGFKSGESRIDDLTKARIYISKAMEMRPVEPVT